MRTFEEYLREAEVRPSWGSWKGQPVAGQPAQPQPVAPAAAPAMAAPEMVAPEQPQMLPLPLRQQLFITVSQLSPKMSGPEIRQLTNSPDFIAKFQQQFPDSTSTMPPKKELMSWINRNF